MNRVIISTVPQNNSQSIQAVNPNLLFERVDSSVFQAPILNQIFSDDSSINESPIETKNVISENWLTRSPHKKAEIIALFSSLIVIIVSLLNWNNIFNLGTLMPANFDHVFTQHEYWRAWTTLLVHADPHHLLGNLFLFTILGYFLMGYFGIFMFPIFAFLFGGITNFFVLYNMPKSIFLVGLSGVVYWIGGAWLSLYFLVENRKTFFQKTLRTLGVALLIFMPSEAFDPSISYQTHLVGFIFGFFFGIIYYLFKFKTIKAAEVYRLEEV